MSDAIPWTDLRSIPASGRGSAVDALRAFVRAQDDALIDHDPDWLAAQVAGTDNAWTFVFARDAAGTVIAAAAFLIHGSAIAATIGPVTLLQRRIRRVSLTRAPLLGASGISPAQALQAILATLRPTLSPRDAPFIAGIECDGAFDRGLAAAAGRCDHFVMPHGHAYPRHRIRLPRSLDAYMAGLGSATRQDLRRHGRRLAREGDPVSFRTFTDAADVPAFLALAESLSKRTYQWRLLHMGVHDTPPERERLARIAAQGWFRSYALFCKGDTVAFMLGYLYNGKYDSVHVGFDPAWARTSPGMALDLHVIQDLIALGPGVTSFDFMYGDGDHKSRLGNESRQERHLHVLPSTLRWRAVAGTVRATERLVDALTGLLDRLRVKQRVERWMRSRASR